MAGSDDLAPLLVPHHSADSGPTPALSSKEPARYGQGVIVEWNPDTFENVVRFRGTTLVNLPVMAGTDALTFQPGDKVGIMYWAPAGGSGVFWILPRIIVPGAGRAEAAIAWMRTAIAEQISAQVLGSRVHSARDVTGGTRSSTVFGDLTGTDPGPAVHDVSISHARRALVFLTARLTAVAPIQGGGEMSVEVSGDSTIGPNQELRALHCVLTNNDVGTQGGTLSLQATSVALLTEEDGLNAGQHTFKAVYRDATGSDPPVSFANRHITVFAF